MKSLKMTLKKEWFDKILSGEKKEEFREVKKHWIERLCSLGTVIEKDFSDVVEFFPKEFEKVIFINGYGDTKPRMEIEFLGIELKRNISTPLGHGDFFVIKLGNIIRTENLKG